MMKFGQRYIGWNRSDIPEDLEKNKSESYRSNSIKLNLKI